MLVLLHPQWNILESIFTFISEYTKLFNDLFGHRVFIVFFFSGSQWNV